MLRARFSLILLASLALAACQSRPPLRGLSLVPALAPDFALTTQAGQMVSLKELQGRVVALTFLDTECTGDCSAITARVREASDQIDYSEAGRVAFLAVTTAPESDSIEKAAQFSHLKGMPANFYFLTGSRGEVEPVWRGYRMPGDEAASAGGRVILIDPGGYLRAYFPGPDFAPGDLRHNIRALLAEDNLLLLPLCH